MAIFNRKPSMPPPGAKKKPVLAVAIGIGKDKPGQQGPDDGAEGPEGSPQGGDAGGQHSAEDALVIRENQHCKDCENYDHVSGSCSKVDGGFAPEDACLRYFEPRGGDDDDDEPDADDMGGPPDGDADDSGGDNG